MKSVIAWGLVLVLLAGCKSNADKASFEKAASELPKAREAAVDAGLAIDDSTYRPPQFAEGDNAAPHYRRAFAIWQGNPRSKRDAQVAEWGLVVTGAAATDFDRYETILDHVIAGTLKPGCDFGRDFSDGFDIPYPEFADMKAMAKALAARALVSARQGNTGEAKRDLVAIQKLGSHAGKEQILIGQLVSIAISKIGLKAVERILGDLGPRPALLGVADEVLAHVPKLSFLQSVRGEIALGTVSIRKIRSAARIKELAGTDAPETSGTEAVAQLSARIDKAIEGIDQQTINAAFEARHLQYWVRAFREGRDLDNEAFGEMLDKMTAEADTADATYTLNRMLNPVYGKAGKAMRALDESCNAFKAGVKILRSGGPKKMSQTEVKSLLDANGLELERTGTGFIVASRTFLPMMVNGKPAAKATYGFTYPYRGKQ